MQPHYYMYIIITTIIAIIIIQLVHVKTPSYIHIRISTSCLCLPIAGIYQLYIIKLCTLGLHSLMSQLYSQIAALSSQLTTFILSASFPLLITPFYRMISIFHFNFVNKLNYDVFITCKNVISLGLFGSYAIHNCTIYVIEPKEQLHKPLLFSFLTTTKGSFYHLELLIHRFLVNLQTSTVHQLQKSMIYYCVAIMAIGSQLLIILPGSG